MGSLIDEALADEKAFREKTAKLLDRAGFYTGSLKVRAGRTPRWLSAVLKRSAAKQMDARVAPHAATSPFDTDALRHLEALDAARWARKQLGR